MNRRSFVVGAGAAWASASVPFGLASSHGGSSDLRLRIEACTLDIGRGVQIATVAYNGQVPGPLLRLTKNKPVTIDVTNATSKPDLVHWHGLTTDSLNDGCSRGRFSDHCAGGDASLSTHAESIWDAVVSHTRDGNG